MSIYVLARKGDEYFSVIGCFETDIDTGDDVLLISRGLPDYDNGDATFMYVGEQENAGRFQKGFHFKDPATEALIEIKDTPSFV